MVVRVFHDAVVDGIRRDADGLVAECSMVCVYDGDSLVRQESGTLTIRGRVCEEAPEPRACWEDEYDDASILELEVGDDVVKLLVEWESYSSGKQGVVEYRRRLGAVVWVANDGETVALS